jgi:fumarate hydratase class II
LQDATPERLGQEFGGFARQAELAGARARKAMEALLELPIGGTAVGTGINTHPEFGKRMCEALAAATDIPFEEAADHFEAQAAKDAVCEASGQLKAIAVGLTKIANDIRLLGSGPRCGIGEIKLPETQPGSSIMPGKVNPVMCEMLIQVCGQAIGNDTAVMLGCRESFFELNVGMPLMAHNLLESIRILSSGARVFANRCVAGIEADEERCQALIEGSLAMCTSLAPKIGYDEAAAVAKEAYKSGKTVREVAKSKKVLSEKELKETLDPMSMTMPS